MYYSQDGTTVLEVVPLSNCGNYFVFSLSGGSTYDGFAVFLCGWQIGFGGYNKSIYRKYETSDLVCLDFQITIHIFILAQLVRSNRHSFHFRNNREIIKQKM